MESNFFRCLAQELGECLAGARIQKIYSSLPTVHTLVLGTAGGKRFLHFSWSKGQEHLFVSQDRFETPAEPDARTMALRKHLVNRRLLAMKADWATRRMAWELGGGDWLVLDMNQGLDIWPDLEPDFGREPDWPDAGDLERNPGLWRSYPQLSPPLRKSLESMASERRSIFLSAIARSACSECFYYDTLETGGKQPVGPLVWRLDPGLLDGRRESVFACAMEAAAHVGHQRLFPFIASHVRDQGADQAVVRSRIKRIRRNLRKLEQEEERLLRERALRADAELIKAGLYALDSSARVRRVLVADPEGGERTIDLDPTLTVADNMARYFKRAAKAERGLAMIGLRRQGLTEEMDGLKQGTVKPRARSGAPEEKRAKPGRLSTDKYGKLQVTAFRTGGGFLALRGKNARANSRLLNQAASPFDYWFHAEDGPGAHVILRRDHPAQEVDRQSLEQAAILAGLKSWQAGSDRARVMMAQVKHVRSFKGAAPGQVRVDQVEESFLVDLDPGLEDLLRIE